MNLPPSVEVEDVVNTFGNPLFPGGLTFKAWVISKGKSKLGSMMLVSLCGLCHHLYPLRLLVPL